MCSVVAQAAFHVARSTRWPCIQYGYTSCMARSNTFGGALILCNSSAISAEGLPCRCSGTPPHSDPLDPNCFTSPEAVKYALASVPAGHKLIGVIDGHSDMGSETLHNPSSWDALSGGFYGPWGGNLTQIIAPRWSKWMNAFKKVGG